MLASYCKAKGIVQSDIMKPEYMEAAMRKYGFKDWDSILAAIGHGGLKEGQVVNKLLERSEKQHKKEMTDEKLVESVVESKEIEHRRSKNHNAIVVKGLHDLAVRFSKCCSPVPGDEIVGFVTRGRGVSIHRTDCVNIINLSDAERVRLIDAEWQKVENDNPNERFPAEIKIYVYNRTGVLVDVSRVLTEMKIDLNGVNSRKTKQDRATITMSFDVQSKEELSTIIAKIRQVESVIDVERSAG